MLSNAGCSLLLLCSISTPPHTPTTHRQRQSGCPACRRTVGVQGGDGPALEAPPRLTTPPLVDALGVAWGGGQSRAGCRTCPGCAVHRYQHQCTNCLACRHPTRGGMSCKGTFGICYNWGLEDMKDSMHEGSRLKRKRVLSNGMLAKTRIAFPSRAAPQGMGCLINVYAEYKDLSMGVGTRKASHRHGSV